MIALVCGCVKAPAPRPPLRIAFDVWPGFAYVYIAQEKGFFKQNGVVVDLVLKKSYSEAQKLYTDGAVDAFFGVYSDAIYHDSESVPTKVVWAFNYSKSSDAIIGKAEYASLKDLKGKRVGFEGVNSFSQFFVLRALKDIAGLSESDVYFENVPGISVIAALDGNSVDAAHTWEPFLEAALQKGYKILAKAGDVPGTITDVFACAERVVQQRPDDIQAVVCSLSQARDFLRFNKTEALAIMARAESIDSQTIGEALAGIELLTLEENYNAMTRQDSPVSLFRLGKDISSFYLERGQLSVVPDISEIVDSRFVRTLYTRKGGAK
ncbi:MAG: ABC transporter substrate-binding protein [Candidatus Omnitrophota bacterium]